MISTSGITTAVEASRSSDRPPVSNETVTDGWATLTDGRRSIQNSEDRADPRLETRIGLKSSTGPSWDSVLDGSLVDNLTIASVEGRMSSIESGQDGKYKRT
jgi:hypothetical protein